MRRRPLSRAALLAVSVAGPLACGASPAPPVASGRAGTDPPTRAEASASPPDPAFVAARGAPAARATNGYNGPLAQGLKETSAWFAPGMVAEGPTYLATLGENGRARTELTLRGDRCQVVVGFSKDGDVVDFDLRLWKTALGENGTLFSEDFDDDTTPTIGKPPICPSADTPVLLELFADKGKGDVAVQVYSKVR